MSATTEMKGADRMSTWTITETAKAAGRSVELASKWARHGLLPGYTPNRRGGRGGGANVPEPLALAYAEVLRSGMASRPLAAMMRSDPAAVLAAAEGLMTLARAAIEQQEAQSTLGEAA